MQVFVAGGTGVLGHPTVRALVEAGHRVRATARGPEKADRLRRVGAEPVDVELYGIYNTSDDNPVTFADYLRLLTEAVRAPRPWHMPAILGPILAGVAWKYLGRSQRVSNARLKAVSRWTPAMKDVAEGWPFVASRLAVTVT